MFKLMCDNFSTTVQFEALEDQVFNFLDRGGFCLISKSTTQHQTKVNNTHYLTVFKSAMAFKKRGKEHVNIYRKTENFTICCLVDCANMKDSPYAGIHGYELFMCLDFFLYRAFVDLREHNTYAKSITYSLRQAKSV